MICLAHDSLRCALLAFLVLERVITPTLLWELWFFLLSDAELSDWSISDEEEDEECKNAFGIMDLVFVRFLDGLFGVWLSSGEEEEESSMLFWLLDDEVW